MTAEKNVWAFADVDDMLISTRRDAPVEGSVVAALDDKGAVCGWLTPKQRRFLDMFRERVDIVLTTARTSKGVSQLRLPVQGYAIVSFGGVIRQPDGRVEPRYRQLIAARCTAAKPVLSELLALVEGSCVKLKINARARLVSDDGLELFLSVKHNERKANELKVLYDLLGKHLPGGWRLHLNGNFLAVLPAFLGKERAVRWFIENISGRDSLHIGMGDSLTDLPFMALCDFAVMPTGSQVFSQLRTSAPEAPHPVRYDSIH